ncbi:uncharacterized protein LOC125942211 [Dermacentor silvarum]|uniref:uncharacterized protein LOC125942211 n=1 Tax=Dermacentor silvarum TaxID=543639 RepID=UPI002100F159|nr:uncharacterized protein LOC125942211 [Dermacentor silvarum]
MLRFLAASLFVLFYSVPMQCATSTTSQACETKICTEDCAVRHGYPINVTVVGTCENDTCRCNYYNYCEEKACADVCLKDYGHKKNLTSLCKGRMCYCYWHKKCVQPECVPLCDERHPDKEIIDVNCKNDVCVCKWREGATRTLKPGAAPVGGLEVEVEHPLRGSHAIFVDVESREVKKKSATS